MSLMASRARLLSAHKELLLRWDRTCESWDDPVSRRIEEEFLVPLQNRVRATLGAMEQMGETLTRARQECE